MDDAGGRDPAVSFRRLLNTTGPLHLEARSVGRRASSEGAWLLRDVSLTVHAGDRLAIAGPSGSGKTLLLRALALLDPLDAGEIVWCGEPVADDRVPAYRRAVVYLHQRPGLFEGRVADNLRVPFELAIHADREYAPERIEKLLEALGRDPAFLDKRATDLSGGEAQMTAFLRALQLDPEALLLDEPTAALDREAAGAIEQLVEAWLQERPGERTIVWVSHDAGQAGRMTGRTIRLEEGRVVS